MAGARWRRRINSNSNADVNGEATTGPPEPGPRDIESGHESVLVRLDGARHAVSAALRGSGAFAHVFSCDAYRRVLRAIRQAPVSGPYLTARAGTSHGLRVRMPACSVPAQAAVSGSTWVRPAVTKAWASSDASTADR